jgi:hypothetical protein
LVPRRAFIFHAVANKQIDGFLTAKQIADLHFFSKKQFRGEENVDVKARQIIRKLLSLFSLIDTLGLDCQNALEIENGEIMKTPSSSKARSDQELTAS